MLEKNNCLILSVNKFDVIHEFLKKEFIDGIRESKWKCVFVNASPEYEVWFPNRIELETALFNSSTQIHILTSISGHNNELHTGSTFINTTYYHNPLYWLSHTYINFYQHNSEYLYNRININPSYLITSLNASPHRHRCLLLDNLHKSNLLNNNNFSWTQLSTEFEQNYKFKYWEEKITEIDEHFITSNHHYANVPQSQFESVFNVVSETTRDSLFWTEKTFIPIALGKPFILMGARNINKELTKFGFKLYDDVIDYNKFDNYLEYDNRVNGLCVELNRLNDSKDFKKILSVLEPTIIHNYNTFHSLFKSYKTENLSFFKLANSYGITFRDFYEADFINKFE
jgi:hypothetical protein